ncbi:hypothetical protein AC578_9481 [Pseudocercospora eumusae]|uniref:Uncharacterized protein n=1 Tax=Pseudocercospora eumusae TaxID=321146 RepID=A0A139GXN8_9PEZI|nr:hypothetical protein AC578_9481 [Pseudocercospora eumusae]
MWSQRLDGYTVLAVGSQSTPLATEIALLRAETAAISLPYCLCVRTSMALAIACPSGSHGSGDLTCSVFATLRRRFKVADCDLDAQRCCRRKRRTIEGHVERKEIIKAAAQSDVHRPPQSTACKVTQSLAMNWRSA